MSGTLKRLPALLTGIISRVKASKLRTLRSSKIEILRRGEGQIPLRPYDGSTSTWPQERGSDPILKSPVADSISFFRQTWAACRIIGTPRSKGRSCYKLIFQGLFNQIRDPEFVLESKVDTAYAIRRAKVYILRQNGSVNNVHVCNSTSLKRWPLIPI